MKSKGMGTDMMNLANDSKVFLNFKLVIKIFKYFSYILTCNYKIIMLELILKNILKLGTYVYIFVLVIALYIILYPILNLYTMIIIS